MFIGEVPKNLGFKVFGKSQSKFLVKSNFLNLRRKFYVSNENHEQFAESENALLSKNGVLAKSVKSFPLYSLKFKKSERELSTFN